MKKISVKILLLFTIVGLCSCAGDTEFDKLVREIGKEPLYVETDDEQSGNFLEQFNRGKRLKAIATREQLMELLDHKKVSVRCYAMYSLSYLKDVDMLPLIMAHHKDRSIIKYRMRYWTKDMTVGNFAIKLGLYGNMNGAVLRQDQKNKILNVLIYDDYYSTFSYDALIRAALTEKHYKHVRDLVDGNLKGAALSPEQKKNIFDVMIKRGYYSYRNGALDKAPLTEKLYTRVRELVIKENDQTALIVLAKFKKENDVDLILANDDIVRSKGGRCSTLMAIENFPHKRFLPLLEKKLMGSFNKRGNYSSLYSAIGKYPTKDAYKLYMKAYTGIKSEKERVSAVYSIHSAINKNYDPVYDPFLWETWDKYDYIFPKTLEILFKKNPKRAVSLIVKYLQKFEKSDMVEEKMKYVLKTDKNKAKQLIRKGLVHENLFIFSEYLRAAKLYNNPEYAGLVLKKLENETDSETIILAVRALASMRNPEINKKILEIRRQKKDILNPKWGIKDFDRVLKDFNVK